MTVLPDPLFFIPATGLITLSNGTKCVVTKGVHPLSPEIVSDPAATRYGIRPDHEMTANERSEHGLPPAAPDVDESIRVDPPEAEKPVDPALAPAPAPAVTTVHTAPKVTTANAG